MTSTAKRYGAFETNPAIFNDTEAWVYQHDKVWRPVNVAEVRVNGALLSEAEFNRHYPGLPPLPNNAFKAA